MSDLTDLIARQAKLEALLAKMERHGVIRKGEKGKYRIEMGINADGTPHMSPWLFPGQHAGIKREDVPFREGQNVSLSMPTGDPRQARILPYSPNTDNPRPVHAAEDICTVQIPHIDKDGKEEKDKNKPGFQRSESSKERTTVVDKKTTHSQTAEKISHEAKDAHDGKVKALLEQTFSKVSRLLDSGGGLTSLLEHEAQRIFHRIGDKVSHEATEGGFVRKVAESVLSHGPMNFMHQIGDAVKHLQNPQGFLREVGQSVMNHGAGQIMHQLGSVKTLLSSAGNIISSGGISHLVSSIGNVFSGGQVSHDGADIGKSHQHMVPGPFGMVTSLIPNLLGGGAPGGGGGGGASGSPGSSAGVSVPGVLDLQFAATPFAWCSVIPGTGGVVLIGNVRNIAVAGDTGNIQVTFLVPTDGIHYRVHAQDDAGQQLKITGRAKTGFQVQSPSAAITRVGITVFP